MALVVAATAAAGIACADGTVRIAHFKADISPEVGALGR